MPAPLPTRRFRWGFVLGVLWVADGCPVLLADSGAQPKQRRGTHPAGASGTQVEVASGAAQFKLRAPEAI
eukprot:8645843-Alexandrium_andersonii.AAC.1